MVYESVQKRIVNDKSNNCLILIYGDNCGWCHQFEETWINIVESNKNNKKLNIATFEFDRDDDSIKHLKSKNLIDGVPFICLIKPKNSSIVVYTGNRTKESIELFIKYHESK